MPIQRKNLFLTWGIRISLVPVILVLLALGLIAIVLFAICGVCGRFLAALGGLAALLRYSISATKRRQYPPSWHSCSVLTARRRCCSGWAESCSSLLVVCMIYTTDWRNL
uniref:hypothetical protein n=1 Tax=Gemmiger formicilis TaxID=745368 RepID=UPI003FEECF69